MTRLAVTDGMRAVAVVAVVVFHTFPRLLPGGFIGVDIFFIISGFVISLVYEERLRDRSLAFVTFYVRRVSRLAPAYIALVLITTAICFAVLLPRDLSNYALSLAMQTFYAQNVAFWIIGDYFEAALAKPLLHTWSLAVEEQFYFIFPAFIIVTRCKRSWGIALLSGLIVASLAIGWIMGGISPKTPFYWLPTRVWEFAMGILAASLYRAKPITGRAAAVTATTGLTLVLVSFFLTQSWSRFPGPQSLLAAAGSVMLLVCQDTLTPVTHLLRNRASQWLGRISYSWYLWHWPPLSLWFLVTNSIPSGANACLLAAIGFAAGVCSFYGIERRVAESHYLLKPANALIVVGAFALFTLSCSAVVFGTAGFVKPYPPQARKLLRAQLDAAPYRCPLMRRLATWQEPVCRLNDVKGNGGVVLIGDSHADRTKTVLLEMANRANVPLFLTKQNCRLSDYGLRADCTIAARQALAASIRRLGIVRAVAIAHWETNPPPEADARLLANVTALGIPMFIQLPTPSSRELDPAVRLTSSGPIAPAARLNAEAVVNGTAGFRSSAANIANKQNAVFLLDPVPTLCPAECLTEAGGFYLYMDAHHLTLAGVTLLKRLYEPIFANSLPPRGKVYR